MRKVIGPAIVVCLLWAAPSFAQEPSPSPSAPAPASAEHAAQPTAEHAVGTTEEHAGAEEHGLIAGLIWPTANFIILCGVLYYYLKTPLTTYLADRSATIRKDLVEAAALKAAATEQLAAVERKIQALPGELDALRKRGAEEIASEELRIAAAAAADRDRLLEQTRREIDLQVRLAKREILEHAADLSVQLATERLKKEITPADQLKLVDQYLTQVKAPQAATPKPHASRPEPQA